MTDVFKDVEFIQVNKNGKTLIHIDGSDVNGKNRTWLANYLADRLGQEGKVVYSTKKLGTARISNTTIRAFFSADRKPNPEDTSKILSDERFERLERMIAQGDKSGGDADKLFKMQEKFFTLQIDSLKDLLAQQRLENERLTKKLNEHKDDEGIDLNQLMSLINLTGKKVVSGPSSLRGEILSNTSSIPGEIIEVLDTVDFTQLSPDIIQKLSGQLKQFIQLSNLPTK